VVPILEIIGAPQSNFVRTARMACVEKGVEYALDPTRPHTEAVDAIHPFGKIPVMRHGGITLCETKAICTYVDLAFDGPALMPRDPEAAARTEQWVSLVNTAIDPVFARSYMVAYFFSGLPDGAPDRARIEAALPGMRAIFAVLERQFSAHAFLAGDGFTIADMFLLPLIHYLRLLPESAAMLQDAPRTAEWFDRISQRPSAQATVPPSLPGRR